MVMIVWAIEKSPFHFGGCMIFADFWVRGGVILQCQLSEMRGG